MPKTNEKTRAQQDETGRGKPAIDAAASAAFRDNEPTESVNHFFKPEDWIAALLTTLISGAIFFYYMAPEVTLEDSGELVTGSFTFGVPHPPGYPLWAFLGYVWSHLIVPFGNPAFRLCSLSVVTGAMTVGTLTIMMTRSIRLLLHSLPWAKDVSESLQHWIAVTIGASTALLFGFNRGVWLWASVSEMRVMNVFSFIVTACFFFAWTMQPYRRGFLYTTLLLYGLSLANHQTIVVMGVPFALGTLAIGLDQFFDVRRKNPNDREVIRLLMTSLASAWELAAAGFFSLMVLAFSLAWLHFQTSEMDKYHSMLMAGIVLGVLGCGVLAGGMLTKWWSIKRALLCTLMVVLGLSFYLYMPLAASTNPPMNWGYARTAEGFYHAVSRGQYEKMAFASPFTVEGIKQFALKIWIFTSALIHQYSLPLTLLGLVSPIVVGMFWWRCKSRGRAWMTFVWAAFVVASIGLLFIINPKTDKQEQEITIKFFAPAHGFYAMMIGYGIAILLSILAWRGQKNGALVARIACVALLGLPIVTFTRNWSLCNLRGHDFGYLFGYLMFNPGGGYPKMDKDAVLYGGTDPGRFVPTYMIFCESRVPAKDRYNDKFVDNSSFYYHDTNFDRSDVYIITQNALADNTYMSYIRDHYDFSRPDADKPNEITMPNGVKTQNGLAKFPGWERAIFRWGWTHLGRKDLYPKEPIYIPNPDDSNSAFKEYVEAIQSGKIQAGADVKIENGRVNVEGVAGVMAINGILAKWIFDRNKDKHSFYVEESYVIPWMYSYLTPHGVIMKLEKDPVPSPQENPKLWEGIIARDKAYWNKLTGDFLVRPDFKRNSDAQKSFSKMRSALAGLYDARGLYSEAEYAFKQSLQLCPDSPEANFRLADLYTRQRRFDEARKLIQTYLAFDNYNNNVRSYLGNIVNIQALDARRQELEARTQHGMNLETALELARVYQQLNMDPQFQGLTRSVLGASNLPVEACMQVAQLFANGKRWELLETALRRALELQPGNVKLMTDIAAVNLAMNKPNDTINWIKRAVDLGGEPAREIIRQDQRFGPLQQNPRFQSLVPPARPQNFNLPF